jgi:hypothetical protein
MRKSGAEAFISKAASISELLKAVYQVGNNKTTIRGTTVSNKQLCCPCSPKRC